MLKITAGMLLLVAFNVQASLPGDNYGADTGKNSLVDYTFQVGKSGRALLLVENSGGICYVSAANHQGLATSLKTQFRTPRTSIDKTQTQEVLNLGELRPCEGHEFSEQQALNMTRSGAGTESAALLKLLLVGYYATCTVIGVTKNYGYISPDPKARVQQVGRYNDDSIVDAAAQGVLNEMVYGSWCTPVDEANGWLKEQASRLSVVFLENREKIQNGIITRLNAATPERNRPRKFEER